MNIYDSMQITWPMPGYLGAPTIRGTSQCQKNAQIFVRLVLHRVDDDGGTGDGGDDDKSRGDDCSHWL